MPASTAGACSTRGASSSPAASEFPRLKVDIEMVGKGEPRILEWEVKTAPFAGIGVLRFHVGTVDSPRGPEEVEQIAIVDLQANTVLGVETQRRGSRLAKMTWDDGKLVIASADGTNDELQLRQTKAAQPHPRLPNAMPGSKRTLRGPPGVAAARSQRRCSI